MNEKIKNMKTLLDSARECKAYNDPTWLSEYEKHHMNKLKADREKVLKRIEDFKSNKEFNFIDPFYKFVYEAGKKIGLSANEAKMFSLLVNNDEFFWRFSSETTRRISELNKYHFETIELDKSQDDYEATVLEEFSLRYIDQKNESPMKEVIEDLKEFMKI